MAFVPFTKEVRDSLSANPYGYSTLYFGFATFVLIYGVFYFFTGFNGALSLAAHERSVEGTVTSISQSQTSGRTVNKNATITYVVDSQRYVIHTPDSALTSSKAMVYYDSTNPSNSSLVTGSNAPANAVFLLVLLGGLFAVFFIPGVIGVVKARRLRHPH